MEWIIDYDNEGPFTVKSDYTHIRVRENDDEWVMEYLAKQDNQAQDVEEGDVTNTHVKPSLDDVWDEIIHKIMMDSEMGKLVD